MKTLPEAKMQYEYFINLDERGEFYADVRDPDGNTVFEIHGFDIFEEIFSRRYFRGDIFEDGFMDHKYDLENLEGYLRILEVMPKGATLVRGN